MANGQQGPERGFQKTLALVGYERTRFAAQAAFARELAASDPAREEEWLELVDKASSVVEAAAERGDAARVRDAVREAERLMAPIGEAAKACTVYCVGHAHIDMNWMWSWPETVSVTIDTLTTVLRLMEEFPQLTFSQSQASVYAILERYRPDLLEQVQRRVREGRWEVTASHWVETDKNMVSGESLCRHLLYTRRYMQRLFGLAPEDVPIDWSPDTFGHAATVPTYLAQGGVRYLYLHRPGVHGRPDVPGAFWWAAADGSRVLVRNDRALGYNGVIGPQVVSHSLVPFRREAGLQFTMFVYGVGDHGGGPTRRDLAVLLDMAEWPVFPKLVFATAKQFFERLEAEGARLPVLEGELNFEFTGCYTTQTLIKKSNRFAEKRLADAEAACLLGERVAGVPYPADGLEQAWRDALFSHFHDILPGSGVRDTRTYAHGLYQQVVAFTASAGTRALRAIAGLVDTSDTQGAETDLPAALAPTAPGSGAGHGSADGGLSSYAADAGTGVHPLVIFNTTEAEREEIVEAAVWDPGWGWESPDSVELDAEGPDGSLARAQVLERGTYWGHRFQRVAFPATVPGLGYSRWFLREKPVPALAAQTEPEPRSDLAQAAATQSTARQLGFVHPCRYAVYERGVEGLENEHLSLEVDPNGGGIRRLAHVPSGVVLVEGAASILQYAVERARPMSAWEIEHTGAAAAPVVTKIERLAAGPYVASLAVSMRVAASELRLVYELRAGDPRLHLRLQAVWLERGSRDAGTPVLRLALPLAFAGAEARPRAVYEIPFGALERSLARGEEVPALRWAAVEAGPRGRRIACVLYNDCKHGHSFRDGILALTLIRGSFEPDPLPEIGQHEVRCGLACVAGSLDCAAVARSAAAFDTELAVVSTASRPGRLPPSSSFLRVEGAVLSGLKRSEDGEALILRFCNPAEQETVARVEPAPLLGRIRSAEQVDLLERRLAAAAVDGGSVSIRVPGRGLASLRIVLEY